MDIESHRNADRKGRPLTRGEVEHCLQEMGSPKKLDLLLKNSAGADLTHFNLHKANSSSRYRYRDYWKTLAPILP